MGRRSVSPPAHLSLFILQRPASSQPADKTNTETSKQQGTRRRNRRPVHKRLAAAAGEALHLYADAQASDDAGVTEPLVQRSQNSIVVLAILEIEHDPQLLSRVHAIRLHRRIRIGQESGCHLEADIVACRQITRTCALAEFYAVAINYFCNAQQRTVIEVDVSD